jgi:hypothetical protein
MLLIWVSALTALSIAFITAVTNPAIMALFFTMTGFLLKLFDKREGYEVVRQRFLAASVTLLSAGLLLFGLLEGSSALVGNASFDSAKEAIQQSENALVIAPWRKEPLEMILSATGALSMQNAISNDDAMDKLRFIAKKDPLAFEPYIGLASIAFYNEQNEAEARFYIEEALQRKPTSGVAAEIFADMEAADSE